MVGAGVAILVVGLSAWAFQVYRASVDRTAEAERLADAERARQAEAEREKAARERAEREAEDRRRQPGPSPGLRLSTTSLDFGTRPTGDTATPPARRVVLTNLGSAPVTFTLRGQGPDTGAFRLVDSNCGSTPAGRSLETSCWLAFAFAPAREGVQRNQLAIRVAGSQDSYDLTLTGIGAPAASAAVSARIGAASCVILEGGRFRIELSGEASGPAGAFLYAASNPNSGVAAGRTICSRWGRTTSADGPRNQGACKRSVGEAASTDWKSSNVYTSRGGGPPGDGIARVYLLDGETYRELAQDRRALECRSPSSGASPAPPTGSTVR
jgi:hypothetical protein